MIKPEHETNLFSDTFHQTKSGPVRAPDAEAPAAAETEDEARDPGEQERVGSEHVERVGDPEEVAHVGEEVERGGVAEPRRGDEEQRGGEDGPAGERAAAAVLSAEQGGSERDGPRAGAAPAPVRGQVGGEMHTGRQR